MVYTPMHRDESKFFEVALKLVQQAGTVVRLAYESKESAVTTKSSDTDLVTETDQAVEKLLIGGLSAEFPDHKFIGEESVSGGAKIEWTDEPTWIIDPIDGTTNFVHRIPMIAICVGLTIQKQLRAGIVYNPITHELYHAQVGVGAYKNGFPLHVSTTKEVANSVLITQLGSIRTSEMARSFVNSYSALMFDKHCHGMKEAVLIAPPAEHGRHEKSSDFKKCDPDPNNGLIGVFRHRSFGSAAINMMMVAQGSCDGYVEYGLHTWDVAAAAVIVAEAGGVLIDPTGAPFDIMSRKVLCTGTMELAKEMSSILTHVDYEPEA